MTEAMMDALKAVAEKHRCDVRGVTCMAVSMGPMFWRNAANITDYDPKRDKKPHWKPAAYAFHASSKGGRHDFEWGFEL